MKLLRTPRVPAVRVASDPAPDIQSKPHRLAGDTEGGQIKVDLAYQLGSLLVVAGWCTARLELDLRTGGRLLQARRLAVPRADVASHFNLTSAADLGFVLVAEHAGCDPIALCWAGAAQPPTDSRPVVLKTDPKLNAADRAALGSAFALLCTSLSPHSEAWHAMVAQAPAVPGPCHSARGFLEMAAACAWTRQAVVVGWLVNAPGNIVWLEDDAGRTYSLDRAYRRFRQDVHDAVGHEFGHAVREAGFVLRIPGLKPESTLRLKTLSEQGVHLLGEIQCGRLPADPVAAARWLFGIAVPIADFHRRVQLVDEPVLAPLIHYRQEVWKELPITVNTLGTLPAAPRVSIIVPLYGRTDFVEHQLIEFVDDSWLREHAELIYVLDDPRLVESFGPQVQALHRLYRMPMTWVWGSVNRGFSGANNLGALQARGDYLLFLNSDVFPRKPGWLQVMVEVLAQQPKIGAVAPRLLFAHGAIQHAGMQYMKFEERGVWGNHHPCMGLDPSLDPCQELTIMSAVTGACLLMRCRDFHAVDGWDTGYLVGDFEDSDLCLKLREAGFRIAYMPTLELTHLERQSFKLLGQDDFRARVANFNAVRHQNRWRHLIEAAAL